MALVLATNTTMVHQYWFNMDHPKYKGNDNGWDYCDYKCITLEELKPSKDFVVVVLSATFKATFSVCYVKSGETLTLWNKVI